MSVADIYAQEILSILKRGMLEDLRMFQTEKEARDRVRESPLRKVLCSGDDPSCEYELAEDVIVENIEYADNKSEAGLGTD